MDKVTPEQLRELAEQEYQHCISLYMPTVKSGNQTEQNAIRFRNLLSRADTLLEQDGFSPRDRTQLLEPLAAYENDHDFWEHQEHGLALFLADTGTLEIYRVPISFSEEVIVSKHFYIKPLARLLADSARFYVLDISLEGPRLFEGDQFGLERVELEGAPKDYEDVLKYDDPEKQIQSHTRMPQREGAQQAQFHGHGQGKDEKENRIRRYFEALASAVDGQLSGGEQVPVFLAGEAHLHGVYRQTSHLAEVQSEGGLPRDANRMSAAELHEQMWPSIRDHFTEELRSAVKRFQQQREGALVSTDLGEILSQTEKAQIDTLVVPAEEQVWGAFDESTGRIDTASTGGEELTDRAVRETLLHGGTVFVAKREQIEADTALFALLRYPG